MAGATLEFDSAAALAVINDAAQRMADTGPLLRDMGEFLMIVHDRRFSTQTAPDGTAWQALSPAYLKRKAKNKDKILQLDGYLANTLRYQVNDNELLFGTNRKYAAIHHFGGTINVAARSQQAYFKQDKKSGEVGNRFVKKRSSNFSQWISMGAYTINIPARPFLGTSADDDMRLIGIAYKYLQSN